MLQPLEVALEEFGVGLHELVDCVAEGSVLGQLVLGDVLLIDVVGEVVLPRFRRLLLHLDVAGVAEVS